MANYKAYPEYKDSGVEWLGEVPSHWNVAKTMHYFKIAMGQTILKEQLEDDGEWPVYSATEGDSYFGYVSSPQVKLGVGDLVIPARGNSIGSVKLVSEKSTTTQTTIYCKHLTQAIYPAFAYYFMLGNRKNLFWFTQTAIPQITVEEVGCNPILLPTYEEQGVVASFLDHETAKIDNLIEKQQQLIELLKEKRQAVISHAVTKGLNPDAPMKDSGVEWLGKVPAHWDSVRVKQVSTFITSGPRGWSDYITDDGDEIFLQSGDLNNELGLHLDKAKRVSPPKNAEGVRTRLMNGDVVICITGANTGRVAIVSKLSQKTYINQHLSLIRPETPKINSSFLGYCLTSSNGRSYFEVAQYGLKEGLNLSNIAEAPLALPPLHEQDAIVKYLKCVQNNYDYLSCLSANQVGLLQERRAALISAAVTGKIDVRDWVAPDTQESEEPQEVSA